MPVNDLCVYEGCTSSKRKNPNLTFHRFPKDEAVRMKWIDRSGNPALTQKSEEQMLNVRMCCLHFLEDDFVPYGKQGKRKLRILALPNDAAVTAPVVTDNVLTCLAISNTTSAITTSEITTSATTFVTTTSPTTSAITTSATTFATTTSPTTSAITTSATTTSATTSAKSTTANTTSVSSSGMRNERSVPVIWRKKRISVCTPKEQKQQRLVKSLRLEIKKKNQKIKRLEAELKRKASAVAFAKAAYDLNDDQLAFFKMQIDHKKKRPWTEDEKQFALSLYYKSPSAYNYLRDNKHFALPCISLIRSWVNDLELAPGIKSSLIPKLAKKVETMDRHERQCILMWDEISIKQLFEYNCKTDLVEGFQDLGELGRTDKCANYALVFMLHGVTYAWKQPIAYVLSHGNVRHSDLTQLTLKVLDSLQSIALEVRYMVCDMGSNNRAVACSFGVTVDTPFIERNGRKIYFGFDVPHLIKCLRNNWFNYDIYDDGELVSANVLRELRNVESSHACRAAPKLTDRHMNPNNFQKMKVSLATQIFSHSVSAAINTGKLTGELKHPACAATANFVKRVNDMFDCLNSRSSFDPNPLRRAISERQPQVEEFLKKCPSWIEKWTLSGSKKNPPCFDGFRLTINSILQFWGDLKSEGTFYLITSRLNQDPIENLFGVLRNRGGHCDNPSASSLRRNLQYNMIAHLMRPPAGANCEPDDDETTLLAANLHREKPISRLIEGENVDCNDHLLFDDWPYVDEINKPADLEKPEASEVDNEHVSFGLLEECSIKYVAGYLAHKCLRQFDCRVCEDSLTRAGQNFEQNNDLLIFWRAFKNSENQELGSLRVPTDEFLKVVITAYQVFVTQFPKLWYLEGVSKLLINSISNALVQNHVDFWPVDGECESHRQYIINHFVRTHLFNHLKWKSRDMRDQVNRKRKQPYGKSSRKLIKVSHQ